MPRSPYPRPSPEDNPCLPKGERTHLRGEGVHDPPHQNARGQEIQVRRTHLTNENP